MGVNLGNVSDETYLLGLGLGLGGRRHHRLPGGNPLLRFVASDGQVFVSVMFKESGQ